MSSRLRNRPRNEHWTWTLHQYKGRPRLVSHRAMAMPLGPDRYVTMRQAVVRIRSVQSLVKTRDPPAPAGARRAVQQTKAVQQSETADPEHAPKDVTEYVVVQQIFGMSDAHQQWKVWGTIEEDKQLWKKYL